MQKFILLTANVIFYAFASPYFVLILLAVSSIAYFTAMLFETGNRQLAKFTLGLTLLLSVLVIFKYVPLLNQVYNFFHSDAPVKLTHL